MQHPKQLSKKRSASDSKKVKVKSKVSKKWALAPNLSLGSQILSGVRLGGSE